MISMANKNIRVFVDIKNSIDVFCSGVGELILGVTIETPANTQRIGTTKPLHVEWTFRVECTMDDSDDVSLLFSDYRTDVSGFDSKTSDHLR